MFREAYGIEGTTITRPIEGHSLIAFPAGVTFVDGQVRAMSASTLLYEIFLRCRTQQG